MLKIEFTNRRFVSISGALVLLGSLSAVGATYHVAPGGSDSNSGTNIAEPFATPQKAVTLSGLAPGDTIYIRGGTYAMNTPVKPSRPGVAGNLIRLWAFPGEKPVFDFEGMGGSSKALDLRRGYWHARGIEVEHAPNNGIFVGGAGNVVEGCVIHDCNNDGLAVGSTSATSSEVTPVSNLTMRELIV